MKYVVFLLALGCIHCGIDEANYQLYGVNVWLMQGVGPEKEELRTVTDFFFDRAAQLVGKSSSKVKDNFKELIRINWEWRPIPVPIVSSPKTGLANGTYKWPDTVRVVWRYSCISKSAYFHELGHHLRQRLLGKDADGTHSEPFWNDVIGVIKTEWSGAGGDLSCSENLYEH